MPTIAVLIIIFGVALGGVTFFFVKSILAPKKVATLTNLLKQGKYTSLQRMAKQILAKDSRNIDAHYLLGQAYLNDNKPELALMEFKTVNQLGNFSRITPEAEFREKAAELYRRFNQQEEALKEYLLLIKMNPQKGEYYLRAGELFEDRNKSDRALNFYRKAVEVQPKLGEAHFKLGKMLYRSKKPVEAKVELDNAVKLRPELVQAQFFLGKILKENHDYVGALLAFEKAQRDPDYKIRSLIERGSAYISMNNQEKAITELERAVKLSIDDAASETLYARYFLAHSYEKMRNLDKAIEQWEQIFNKKPTFKDVAEKLSQYQDLRTDDRMKDYLTSPMDVFYEICKNVIVSMGLNLRDLSDIPNGCQIVAVEDDQRWRNARKMPKILRFIRIPEMINEDAIRSLLEEMKNLSVSRGIIISSSNFSRKAMEFAESRPIDLFNKDKLQELLKKAEMPDQQPSRKR